MQFIMYKLITFSFLCLLISLCSCSTGDNSEVAPKVPAPKEEGRKRAANPVSRGLNWLKNNQNPDGSWGQKSDVNLTCLCLLALSEHGEGPMSQEFGESVAKALKNIVTSSEEAKSQNPLLAIAITQYYIQLQIPGHIPVIDREAKKILASQNQDGCFKYNDDIFKLGKDNACSQSLNLLALSRISLTRFGYDDKLISAAMDNGVEYLASNYYSDEKNAFKLFKDDIEVSPLATAIACYALLRCGYSEVPEVKSSVKWLDAFVQEGLEKPVK